MKTRCSRPTACGRAAPCSAEQLNLYGDYDRVYRDLYSSCLPIHRKNLQKLCDAYYGDNAVFQAADSVMAPLSVQEFREEELYLALFDIYRDYYEYGLTDARECARLLQERAWLYLNE